MENLPKVLMYGKDASLTETRRLLLHQAGFMVRTAFVLLEFEAVWECAAPDVVVLCHTLSQQDCDDAIGTALRMWPGVRCLVLTAGDRGCWRPQATAAVDATDGPRKLIRTVTSLAVARGASYPQVV